LSVPLAAQKLGFHQSQRRQHAFRHPGSRLPTDATTRDLAALAFMTKPRKPRTRKQRVGRDRRQTGYVRAGTRPSTSWIASW
jgi:hypothetical protein